MTTAQRRRSQAIVAAADHDARFRYDQALVEGAAQRGDLGVEAYLIAHDLIAAPAPLDCADLATLLRTDRIQAAITLGRLSRPQFVCQAYAYAAYLSVTHGEAWAAEAVLLNWERGLAHHGVAVR